MYEYISGSLVTLNPAEAIVEAGGLGYRIYITLNTYSRIQPSAGKDVRLFLYHLVREDDEALYGFADADERAIFLQLISVSGVGPSVARMILSSLSGEELRSAILTDNVSRIKSVKGIGQKTAQRIIVDLKDKISKTGGSSPFSPPSSLPSGREEAFDALVSLGFARAAVDKALDAILASEPGTSVENLIKKALKVL